MNPEQIRLVQTSFRQLAPDAPQLADLLFARWFQLDPAARRLFRTDLPTHKTRWTAVVAGLIHNLDPAGEWQRAAVELGERHRHYDAQPSHFDSLGVAFIWTLENGIGEQLTFEVLNAWVAFYRELSAAMQAAAPEPAAN